MDYLQQVAIDIQSIKKELREVTSQALDWHDFVSWLQDEKELPIQSLLAEFRLCQNEEE